MKQSSKIHLLEVAPPLDLQVLSKLARRYAMTGGYELALAPNLSVEELNQLAEQCFGLCDSYPPELLPSSNPGRILSLLFREPKLSQSNQLKIQECLARKGLIVSNHCSDSNLARENPGIEG